MELAISDAGKPRRLIMAAISHVFTISRVAEMLGEDWLQEISIEMDPEDGRLAVWGIDDETITAFTDLGIENLAHIVEIYKADPDRMPRHPKAD